MLLKHFGSCRYVWNYFLDLRNRKYVETGKGMSYKDMSFELKLLKRTEDHEWLKEVNSQSLQQSLMHLDTAFERFFKHLSRYPNFMKKSNRQSFNVPQHFSVIGNKLYIPKFGDSIRIFRHRDFNGEIRNITISQIPSGKYFVSILVHENDTENERKKITKETAIGIDVGLKNFLTTSDTLKIETPAYLRKSEKRLRKAQKRLSQKKKGSSNRNKQRIRVARIHEHTVNQRDDFLNKLSDVLTRNYDTIAVESLNINGMMKNHHVARSIGDAGWSSFFAMLKTKALQRGKSIVEIGRFDPSSKLCSGCGNIKHDLKLSDRIYHCEVCKLTIDRDVNAAINIRRFALIKSGVPTDGGEFTPVDRSANTISLLKREGVWQVH